MTPMFSAYVVVGEPPTDVATTVAMPSAAMARPSTGSRSRLVIALTALTWPAFSAMSAITAGGTRGGGLKFDVGEVQGGETKQAARPHPSKMYPAGGVP